MRLQDMLYATPQAGAEVSPEEIDAYFRALRPPAAARPMGPTPLEMLLQSTAVGLPGPPPAPPPVPAPQRGVGANLGVRPAGRITNEPVGSRLALPALPAMPALPALFGGGEEPAPVMGPPNAQDLRFPTGPASLDAMLAEEMRQAQALSAEQGAASTARRAEVARRDLAALLAAGVPEAQAVEMVQATPQARGVSREALVPPPPAQISTEFSLPEGEPLETRVPRLRAAAMDAANSTEALAPRVEGPRAGTTPPAGAGGGGGGGGGRPLPTLNDIPDPNYDRVLELFRAARPEDFQADQQRLWQMALLGGLANLNFTPGERLGFGLARGIAGGAQGAMQESNRQEARREGTQREQRQWQTQLAGLVGQQEEGRYGRAVQRRTFERDSEVQNRELALRGAGLDIQRQDLELRRQAAEATAADRGAQRLLRQLQITEMADRIGATQDERAVLMDVVPRIASGRPGSGGLAAPPGFRVQVGEQQLSVDQLRDQLVRQRTSVEFLRQQPLAGSNPASVNDWVESRLQTLIMDQIALLPPEERSALLRTFAALRTRAPRAGTPVEASP